MHFGRVENSGFLRRLNIQAAFRKVIGETSLKSTGSFYNGFTNEYRLPIKNGDYPSL
jgi:hypothetical protein